MLKTFCREIRPEEEACLQERVRPLSWQNVFGNSAIAAGCSLFVLVPIAFALSYLVIWSGFFDLAFWTVFGYSLVGSCALLFLVFFFKLVKQNKARRLEVRRELDNNKLKVVHCTVSDAVQIIENEDEGLGYYFQVEDDKVLHIQGQFLYQYVFGEGNMHGGVGPDDYAEVEGAGCFPATEFELYFYTTLNEFAGLEVFGKRLTPSKRIKLDASFVRYGDVFEVLSGKLDDVVEAVGRGASNCKVEDFSNFDFGSCLGF